MDGVDPVYDGGGETLVLLLLLDHRDEVLLVRADVTAVAWLVRTNKSCTIFNRFILIGWKISKNV